MNTNGTNGNNGNNGDIRIGFYICHCGHNIAALVDCPAVAQYAAKLPGVVVSRDYKYMCSDPGQELIQQDIREHKLNRVVVASCSPLLHEHTFRDAVAAGGLNPFFFQMVNIREHDSWVHTDPAEATAKAKSLAHAAIRRVRFHKALEMTRVPIHPDVLVVGGGITGIHAAITLANAGKKVFLVEREPSIGGHMAKFDKTFPTLDCAACILTPKMSAVRSHPNITLWTYSEVVKVEGYVGNYVVTVKRKPRYVNEELCVGCQECIKACIFKEPKFPDEFNVGLSKRKPVYIPFPQAVPQVVVIDPERCIQVKTGSARKPAWRRAPTARQLISPKKSNGSRLRSATLSWPPVSSFSTPNAFPNTATAFTPTWSLPLNWSAWSPVPARRGAKSFCATGGTRNRWGSFCASARAT